MEIKLDFFGHFSLCSAGAEVPLQPRSQRLLAILFFRQQCARVAIATRLWPESTEAQARTNLRRELHLLQRQLPEPFDNLTIDRHQISWHRTPTTTVDVEQFDLHHRAFAAGHNHDDLITNGEAALAAYRGPLLGNFEDAWIEPIRAKYAASAESIAAAVAETLITRQAFARAQSIIDARLVENPLSEQLTRQQLRLLVASGQSDRAKVTLTHFEERLHAELGLTPSDSLRAALHSAHTVDTTVKPLEDGSPTSHSTTTKTTTTTTTTNTGTDDILIGRSPELAFIDSVFQQCCTGNTMLALVSGEPGIGKSTLLNHWLHQSQAKANVLHARCEIGDTQTPYSLLTQWLRADNAQLAFNTIETAYQQEVARVFPECVNAKLAPPDTAPHPRARHILFQGLNELFSQSGKPSVLVIDDLQWIDLDSLAWLQHFINARSVTPVLLLAGARTQELNDREDLQALLLQMRSTGACEQREISVLSLPECFELAQQATEGGSADTLTIRQVCRYSGGNPLFLREMLTALNRINHTSPPSDQGAFALEKLASERMLAVIQMRLQALDEKQQLVARVAALAGKTTPPEILGVAGDLSDERTIDVIESLVQLKILYETEEGDYGFCHDCIRESVLAALSSARKRFLHHRIALAYQAHCAPKLAPVVNRIAFHFSSAGESSLALHWYEKSVENAELRFAYCECLSSCESALQQIDTVGVSTEYLQQRVKILLIKARVASALYGFAAQLVTQTCRELKNVLDTVDDITLKLAALDRLRMLAMSSADLPTAGSYAKQMIALTETGKAKREYSAALRASSIIQLMLGHYRSAQKLVVKAVKVGVGAEPDSASLTTNSDWNLIMSRLILAHLNAVLGLREQSQISLDAAQRHPRDNVGRAGMVHLFLAHALSLYYYRDRVALRRLVKQMRNYNLAHEDPKLRSFELVFGGWAHEDGEQALRLIKEGIDQYHQLYESHFLTQWYLSLADRLVQEHHFAPALEMIEKGLSVSRIGGGVHLNVEFYRLQGVALTHVDTDRKSAVESFTKALATSQSQGAALFKLRTLRDRLKFCPNPDPDWLLELRRELDKSRTMGDCIEHFEIDNLLGQFT